MTEQEQIEEMRSKIYYARSKVNGIATSNDIAERLYSAGYRKVDDVLNEQKDKMVEREYMGVKYKEKIFYESEINDMIVEVQNAEDKS
mgnify:CR=1 FL=1|nr:MAG TPA: hypothetical protein [Caudoviricetes sp.]